MSEEGVSNGEKSTSTVKYLQILPGEVVEEPSIQPRIPLDKLTIHLIPNISVSYYRSLYNKTGSIWLWNDRNVMTDEKLYSIISDPEITVHVLRVQGGSVSSQEESKESKSTSSGILNSETSEKSAEKCVGEQEEGSQDDAGYFELEWRKDASGQDQVEVSYFGLMPSFIGQRIGPWFLYQVIQTIRKKQPSARIWVHTCSWDHPKAYETYVKGGFKYYKEEIEPIVIPNGYQRPVTN